MVNDMSDTEEPVEYLFLGGDHQGERSHDDHDERLSDGYSLNIHMIQIGDGPFKHFRLAIHETYDGEIARDIRDCNFPHFKVEGS